MGGINFRQSKKQGAQQGWINTLESKMRKPIYENIGEVLDCEEGSQERRIAFGDWSNGGDDNNCMESSEGLNEVKCQTRAQNTSELYYISDVSFTEGWTTDVPPGLGWVVKVLTEPRGKHPKQWLSPKLKLEFRCHKYAVHFESIVQKCSGDEIKAFKIYSKELTDSGKVLLNHMKAPPRWIRKKPAESSRGRSQFWKLGTQTLNDASKGGRSKATEEESSTEYDGTNVSSDGNEELRSSTPDLLLMSNVRKRILNLTAKTIIPIL
mmetsp:Transcript_7198/g.15476  ORF Transcript_7198/g.15476 Transcript_7198/m.15476 type:complete len:266 (+) Transcript_7198:564-1361(+)